MAKEHQLQSSILKSNVDSAGSLKKTSLVCISVSSTASDFDTLEGSSTSSFSILRDDAYKSTDVPEDVIEKRKHRVRDEVSRCSLTVEKINPSDIVDEISTTKADRHTSRKFPSANKRQLDLYYRGTHKLRERRSRTPSRVSSSKRSDKTSCRANNTQLSLYERGTHKLRQQRTKAIQRASSSKRTGKNSFHANNTQIALYEKGVAKGRKVMAKTIEEKNRIARSGIVRATPKTNARCEGLYNLSKRKQLQGKIRRHEVLMKSEYYQTLLTRSPLQSSSHRKAVTPNSPKRSNYTIPRKRKIKGHATPKVHSEDVNNFKTSSYAAEGEETLVSLKTTNSSLSTREDTTKPSEYNSDKIKASSPSTTELYRNAQEENTDSRQSKLQEISRIMEYAASRSQRKKSELDTMDTILLQQSLRTVEEEVEEEMSRDDFHARNDDIPSMLDTLSEISTIQEEYVPKSVSRIDEEVPIIMTDFDDSNRCDDSSCESESRMDRIDIRECDGVSSRTGADYAPFSQPFIDLAEKVRFSSCAEDGQIELIWE